MTTADHTRRKTLPNSSDSLLHLPFQRRSCTSGNHTLIAHYWKIAIESAMVGQRRRVAQNIAAILIQQD